MVDTRKRNPYPKSLAVESLRAANAFKVCGSQSTSAGNTRLSIGSYGPPMRQRSGNECACGDRHCLRASITISRAKPV
jgi:hypothetical protein